MNYTDDFNKARLERLKKVREQDKRRSAQVLNKIREFDSEQNEILKERQLIRERAVNNIQQTYSELVKEDAIQRRIDSIRLAKEQEATRRERNLQLLKQDAKERKSRVNEAVYHLRKEDIEVLDTKMMMEHNREQAADYSETIRQNLHDNILIREKALNTIKNYKMDKK